MRNHEQIKQCKDISGTAHRGPFMRLNDSFSKCTLCGSIVSMELLKGKQFIEEVEK